jgi:hypothetical protein
MADVLRGPCGLAGRVPVDRVPFRGGEPERRVAPRGMAGWLGPVAAQLRQGEPGGQPPAAVPDHTAIFGRVARQADRVPSHLAGAGRAVPQPDQHPGSAQAGEELLLRARSSRCLLVSGYVDSWKGRAAYLRPVTAPSAERQTPVSSHSPAIPSGYPPVPPVPRPPPETSVPSASPGTAPPPASPVAAGAALISW